MNIAIYGYGNIGRGVECAILRNQDMKLTGIYTRRDPASIHSLSGAPVYRTAEIDAHREEIDVVVICGGSATDLPVMTPDLASRFTVVDSFDNHSCIPQHFAAVDAAAKKGGTAAVISGGWDPGLFSMNRVWSMAVMPGSDAYTFWGRGVSQGHSDAIRRIPGVLDAREYTAPVPAAMEAVRCGNSPVLTAREKHTRECYVVAAPEADKAAIETAIKTMPGYFADYDTSVEFISAEEMKAQHSELPHGGSVLLCGMLGMPGKEHKETVEYSLELESNPEFTGSVLTALARAAFRFAKQGRTGAFTILDLAPADVSPLSPEELRAHWL